MTLKKLAAHPGVLGTLAGEEKRNRRCCLSVCAARPYSRRIPGGSRQLFNGLLLRCHNHCHAVSEMSAARMAGETDIGQLLAVVCGQVIAKAEAEHIARSEEATS